eukprot:14509-Heterococcus_DN1.PRE.4
MAFQKNPQSNDRNKGCKNAQMTLLQHSIVCIQQYRILHVNLIANKRCACGRAPANGPMHSAGRPLNGAVPCQYGCSISGIFCIPVQNCSSSLSVATSSFRSSMSAVAAVTAGQHPCVTQKIEQQYMKVHYDV